MSETYAVSGTPDSEAKYTISKHSTAELDYPFNWTDWLNDIVDTIDTFVCGCDTGVTIDNAKTAKTGDSLKVVVWVSGGTVGTTYRVWCRITTVGGRIDERAIYIKIKDV